MDTSAYCGSSRMIPGFHHRFKYWLETYKTLDAANDAVNLLGTAVPVPGKKGDLILWKTACPMLPVKTHLTALVLCNTSASSGSDHRRFKIYRAVRNRN